MASFLAKTLVSAAVDSVKDKVEESVQPGWRANDPANGRGSIWDCDGNACQSHLESTFLFPGVLAKRSYLLHNSRNMSHCIECNPGDMLELGMAGMRKRERDEQFDLMTCACASFCGLMVVPISCFAWQDRAKMYNVIYPMNSAPKEEKCTQTLLYPCCCPCLSMSQVSREIAYRFPAVNRSICTDLRDPGARGGAQPQQMGGAQVAPGSAPVA